MTKLVPLVIVVLEHLESQVDLSQKKTVEITDLKRSIERLKEAAESQRDKHERERNDLKTKLLEVEKELRQYKHEAVAGKEAKGMNQTRNFYATMTRSRATNSAPKDR